MDDKTKRFLLGLGLIGLGYLLLSSSPKIPKRVEKVVEAIIEEPKPKKKKPSKKEPTTDAEVIEAYDLKGKEAKAVKKKKSPKKKKKVAKK